MKMRTAMCLAAIVFAANCSIMNAQTLTTLGTFNGSNGDLPYSGLVADSVGNLYGTTFYGGDDGAGAVYKVDGVTHAISTIGSFDITNGANPVNYGQLVIDSAGNLYGTTATGGANHSGTVFEWSASTHAITTLVSFDQATTGYLPYGSLSVDSTGNLFGTTQFGGPGNGGSVFEIAAGTQAFTTLKTFKFQDAGGGWSPISAPIVDAKGNLYGATANTIYKIDVGTHEFTTVATFSGDNGEAPTGLVANAVGKMFGTTRDGGTTNNGVVFEFDPSTQSLTTLASFDGTDGSLSHGPVTIDANGNLYGTTYFGGANGAGTVFEFNAMTGAITTLASFDGNNSAGPTSTPLVDANGNLFGTTTGGEFRPADLGTVFEVSVPEPTFVSILIVLGLSMRRRRRTLS